MHPAYLTYLEGAPRQERSQEGVRWPWTSAPSGLARFARSAFRPWPTKSFRGPDSRVAKSSMWLAIGRNPSSLRMPSLRVVDLGRCGCSTWRREWPGWGKH